MSDDSVQVSAAPFAPLNKPVVRTVDIDQPPKDYQTAELLPLPSKEVLQEIGRAAIRFGQLEHLLKVIYKRSDKNDSLDSTLAVMGSLISSRGWLHKK